LSRAILIPGNVQDHLTSGVPCFDQGRRLPDLAQWKRGRHMGMDHAIVDELGDPLNPPGSLTGIPLEKLIELGLYKAAA